VKSHKKLFVASGSLSVDVYFVINILRFQVSGVRFQGLAATKDQPVKDYRPFQNSVGAVAELTH